MNKTEEITNIPDLKCADEILLDYKKCGYIFVKIEEQSNGKWILTVEKKMDESN